jgi:thermitase
MVAGAVHLVAPTAKILPLRAFASNGEGRTSDVLRAIYYSVYRGAKVLNMSFSRPTSSKELQIALNYATTRGLIAVASVGNEGTSSLRYPAAYDNVIGVASTNNEDVRSSFSNYGYKQTSLAGPGEGVITTYPWGSYAGAWGTSFSTPLVSGTAALLAGIDKRVSHNQAAYAISKAKLLGSELGAGRLDVYKAVQAGRALYPYGAKSLVPESCASADADWSPAQ